MLDFQQNLVENKFLIFELRSNISKLIQDQITSWEEHYKSCMLNKYPQDAPYIIEYHPTIELHSNAITLDVYLIGLWSKFINESLSNLLDPEAYYLMQNYLLLTNQIIIMQDNLDLLEPGTKFKLNLDRVFHFANNSDLNFKQSFETIRATMESTMFDLFAEYLEHAILNVKRLKSNILINIQLKKFDDLSINYAKENLSKLDEIFMRLEHLNPEISSKQLQIFNNQINVISQLIKPNDILHVTFGTNGDSLQIFPFILEKNQGYAWYAKPNILFGDQNSSYFGIHIDPCFANQFELLKCYNTANLSVDKSGFGKAYDLQVLNNPKISKNNFFMFNAGNVELVSRDYSKKAKEYFPDPKFIHLAITKLLELLEKGVIILIGSHFTDLDQERQMVGPFKLKELMLLKNEYPYDFHLIFGKNNTKPELMEGLPNKVEDVLGYNNPINWSFNFIEQKSSFISNKTTQATDSYEKQHNLLNASFSIVSNSSMLVIDNISLASAEHSEKHQYKCIIS